MSRRAFDPALRIGCYTTCMACRFDMCNGKWHTKADADDVWDWETGGKVGEDPRLKQCGCWCQLYTPKVLIHNGRKP